MASVNRFAIIVSRFPKFTETFIVQELQGLQDRGLQFELFSIIHETPEQLQPEAADLDARAHYIEWRSREVLGAQWYWIRKNPAGYFQSWWTGFTTSWRSREAILRFPLLVVLAAAMARRMERLEVSHVHAHWATYPTLVALCVKRLTGIGYSFTGHAFDIFSERSGLGTKVDEADLVLTCTDHGRGILQAVGTGPADRIQTVHHGVRLETFKVVPLRERGRADPLRVLCVAALETYKGHEFLFHACADLVSRGLPIELTLVGDGELRNELGDLARSLCLDVRFEGRQPSERVRDWLEWCDCFSLASIQLPNGLMDGIPNVCVEALAMGRPVVASSLAGIRELIIDGETGLLAEPRDASSVAAQLRRIASEPELVDRLVLGGRAKVETEHDAAVNLDEIYRLLSRLG